jgi:ribA/ribD-fused uncharacterized protein
MTTVVEDIRFYAVSDPYGEFSNFALYPIKLDGVTWATVEHYFQAQKFDDKAYQDKIRNAASPMKAAELGRSRRMKIVRNWDKQKDNVMYTALLAKFTQHADLQELLFHTGDARLIEHTENDSYWGDGGDGSGQNRLGKLLMTVRKNLLEKS